MNLIQFMNYVDAATAKLSRENLENFIHYIARVLPEVEREDFLEKLHDLDETAAGGQVPAGGEGEEYTYRKNPGVFLDREAAITQELQRRLSQVREEVRQIEEGELYLVGSLNEEYDDWYNSDEDEFLFEDPEHVMEIIKSACDLIHQCVDCELYEESCDLAERLLIMEITVEGDYMDYGGSNLSLKEIKDSQIGSFDYGQLVMDALCAAYWSNPLGARPAALYRIIMNSGCHDITLEALIQSGKKELEQLPDFLILWVQYLGAQTGAAAERFLKEAVVLQNDSVQFLEAARTFSEQHPSLFEQYLKVKLAGGEFEAALGVGQEALRVIPPRYIVRSSVALLTAVCALRLNEQKEAEQCWLEAFRSDTNLVNYLRLAAECLDFSGFREETGGIYRNCFKNSGKETVYQYRGNELCENRIDKKMYYALTFFEGRFRQVVTEGMDEKNSLGWSFTFMKEGIALFLLYLYRGDHLPAGCTQMCSMVCQSGLFAAKEYAQGLTRAVSTNSNSLFWECFCKWREMTPMPTGDEKWVMEKLAAWIQKRVEGIMNGNHRKYYGECAAFIAAFGEVRESRGETDGKERLMNDYRAAYSRRTAFHGELRAFGMKGRGK